MTGAARLGYSRLMHKSASALIGDVARIARGPGRMVGRLIAERPLIGAGLDNLVTHGGTMFGDLPLAMQRGIVSSPLAKQVPMTSGIRTQIAQYLRSAKPKYEYFSGAPKYYPESQFYQIAHPAGALPIRYHGPGWGPGSSWVSSMYKRPPVSPGGEPFTAGSTGISRGGMWKGLELPEFPT